jgi:hypothetical protein
VRGRVSVRCRMTRRWESKGNSVLCVYGILALVSAVSAGRSVAEESEGVYRIWPGPTTRRAALQHSSPLPSPSRPPVPWIIVLYCLVSPQTPACLPACLVHAHAAVLRSSCRRPMQLQMHCASFGRSKHPQSAPRLFNGAAQLTQAVQPLPPCTAADMDASGYRAGYRVQGCSF